MDIYFKKVPISKDKKKTVETALRKFALKRKTSLDFHPSSSDLIRDKYFLGLETDTDLKFTRIRTSFERILPKLIISLPKDQQENYYKLRLSLLSSIVFILLALGILFNIVFLAFSITNMDSIFGVIFFFIIFTSLILVEINLTESRVEKAYKDLQYLEIKKSQELKGNANC